MDFLELEGVVMMQVGDYRQHQLALIFLNFLIIVKRRYCAKSYDTLYHQVQVLSCRKSVQPQGVDNAVHKVWSHFVSSFDALKSSVYKAHDWCVIAENPCCTKKFRRIRQEGKIVQGCRLQSL